MCVRYTISEPLANSLIHGRVPSGSILKLCKAKNAHPITSGLQYRALELKHKLPQMTEEEMLALLATDGMLVKRPILITEETVLVGFKPADWEKLL